MEVEMIMIMMMAEWISGEEWTSDDDGEMDFGGGMDFWMMSSTPGIYWKKIQFLTFKFYFGLYKLLL